MKCEIKWVDECGRPTPDENEAVGYAHSHESIWSMPCGGINNKIVGYNPHVIRQSFPVCAEHMAEAERQRLSLANGGWSFTPLVLTPEDLREWPEFKEAFGWTRMFLLIQEIDAEQRRRDQMSGCLFD